MCLNTVVEQLEPNDEEVFAWKVFQISAGELHFPYYGIGGSELPSYANDYMPRINTTVPLDKWLVAENKFISSEVAYVTGFHVFPDNRNAENWAANNCLFAPSDGSLVVKQVKVKKIRLKGLQNGLKVLVADRMFVPAETPVEIPA